MVQGLTLGVNGDYLEKYAQNTAELSLLAKGDGTEVMLQKIKADQVSFIDPAEDSDLMEYFYVLDGQVVFESVEERKVLNKGDYFYVHHLKEVLQFRTATDTMLLYITTKPIFHYLSQMIHELGEIAKKSQEKDAYTHNHGERVKYYAVKIANSFHLSQERIENLAFASLFHDIGKINVPDEILQKPGRLTNDEMEYIKKHPEDGASMVEKTYYKNLGIIIEQHHERLDGSGYPKGLQDEEICLEARIIAVTDTYDAMTTDRPYRKGMSPDTALAEIKSLVGKHYDQKVVETLEQVLKEEGALQEKNL